MGTTTYVGIPYVEPGDALINYPAAMKAQSDRIDTTFAVPARTTRDAAWLTPAAGWSLQLNQCDYYINGWRIFYVVATRTGAAITVPANGDIANTAIGTCTTVGIGAIGPTSAYTSGRLSGYSFGANTVSLITTVPGSNIATGEAFSCCGMFMGGQPA